MTSKSALPLLCILLCGTLPAMAQNATNSPYTRFGYGMQADRSFAAGRAMGGIGYGLRSSRQINPMNPASYTSMDSLTFLFDGGLTAQMSWFDDGSHRQHDFNGNVEYAAMQFPLHRQIAVSIGLLPYSFVGYAYSAPSQGDTRYTDRFDGSGGLNEVYGGLSVEPWKKRLSIGANISYMFGTITHNSVTNLTKTFYWRNRMRVHNIKYDFGVQYVHPLSRTDRLTLGAVYSPKRRLGTTVSHETSFREDFSTIVEGDTMRNAGFDIPDVYGAGLSYTKDYKMTLAADVSYRGWSKAQFYNRDGDFNDQIRVALGGEYIPNAFTRAYLQRVRYRAGLHYSNSYVKVNGSGYKEYGLTLGAGFPMLDNRSFLNASLEYIKVAPEQKGLINEQYLRFTVSYTFNEYWFFKRKVD